jgi:hypothetical protein
MRVRCGPVRLLPALPGLVLGLSLGCGAHLHRPHDAAAAEQAEVELKGARLTEGFAPELALAADMLTQELAAARAWAQTGRDRDLLDVLSATAVDENDPETEILLHPRCRGRFKGDGWSTMCSKLTRRIEALGGLTLPFGQVVVGEVKPAAKGKGKEPVVKPTGPDALVMLLVELRKQMRAWHGPQSDAARLAKAGTDFVVTARAAGLSAGSSPPPRCPDSPARPGVVRTPEVEAEAERVRGLCTERRNNLVALKTASCAGVAGCTGGLLARQAEAVLAVHDALAVYDVELARRLDAYAAARRPCEASGGVAVSTAGPSAPAVCDAAQVDRAFAAIGQIPPSQVLEARGFGVLGRQGRAIQLGEQIAALDQLIESREARPEPGKQTAAAGATVSPALARALHSTIEGIDRVQAVVDGFELVVLTLIRETLRVERAALDGAIGHAERRRRIDVAKLAAQLEEYTQLISAYIDLQRAERAGCAGRPIVDVQAQDGCRDETTRMLLAYSNAWTLGRAGQQQADVLELGVRHEASIDRSRAAMAAREVYLAAGVAELAKFNRGGIRPEVLAQIIVSAVGFGVVAGGVY